MPKKKFTEIWEEKGLQEHFEKAKNLLTLAVQLNHPDPNAPLSLVTDASSHSIGAVLQQFTDNEWRPLGYFSKHLSPDKVRWTCFRRELLAVKEAVRHFNTEIVGRHLTILTDHRAIVDAFKSPTAQSYDPVA